MQDRNGGSAYRTGADERGYEFDNPSPKGLFLVLIGLSVTLVVILFITMGLYHLFTHIRTFEGPVSQVPISAAEKFPGPGVQVAPHEEWQELYDRQQKELHSYGWVDQKQGIVRIPIDRAFQLLLQENKLPIRGEKTEKKPTITPLELQQERAKEQTPGRQP